MTFSAEEAAACRRLVEMAWEEDLGPQGVDLTTQSIISPTLEGRAVFVARAEGVVAGLPAVELVLNTPRTPLLILQALLQDGSRVQRGDRLATVSGLMQFILMAERTALNFLQHMSGIATLTRCYVDAVAGLPCQILDTRKTTPGWRLLEKYAVRCGGGHNHRMGLYDGWLIKDNHLASWGGEKPAFDEISRALSPALIKRGPESPVLVEVEVENMGQLDRALAMFSIIAKSAASIKSLQKPNWTSAMHILLLDNMSLDQLREAVRKRNEKAPQILLEASGGITLDNVRAIAETGVDRISVGALTHSAPALDIALDYEPSV
jgi:nicotinate-nucleotide pyrophosphorylase (carboxylating)